VACFLGALIFSAHIFVCGSTSFVTGASTFDPFDTPSVCAAMVNSWITYGATTFQTSSTPPTTEADVSVDLSPFCTLRTERDFVAALNEAKSREIGLNSTYPFYSLSVPQLDMTTCVLMLLNFSSVFPVSYSSILYWNRNVTAGDPPRDYFPILCPVANEPGVVPSSSDDMPVSLQTYDPKWYTCTPGGAAVSPPSGALPVLDVSLQFYPVPVAIAHSGVIPITRGSIKTCKLVPTPQLLIVTIVPILSVFIIGVCLSCWFWSRCPVYKWRNPSVSAPKKIDDHA
jgi:hypothetical protein